MKNMKRLSVLLIALFSVSLSFGQQITDLRINEMLIKNEKNFIDEYGRHTPWVEIFNTSYNSVNVAGCFLTDDTTGLAAGDGNPNWYRIPSGDVKTLIPQRGHLIFYLDNSALYGTFHTNFDPTESKNNYVALISSNAKTLIHIFHYPASLRTSDKSYGSLADGESEMGYLEYFTPGSTNKVEMDVTKSEKLMRDDPYGIGMAVISMAVVFSALILIYLMLKVFGLVNRKKQKTAAKAAAPAPVAAAAPAADKKEESITGQEIAAIATALHLHLNSFHDEESEVITIETQDAVYSPWAQKHLTIKRVQRR